MYRSLLYLPFLLFFVVFSCKPSGSATNGEVKQSDTINSLVINAVEMISPVSNEILISGKILCFKAKLTDPQKTPDSIAFLMDGKHIGSVKNASDSILLNSSSTELGDRNAEVIAYFANGVHSFDHHKVFIKLDKKPALYTYKVIHTYPHDRNAYTQGLIYENGIFYEGTGLYKQSTLRKVKLETGEPMKTLGLPESVFGEGIAVFDNKIIQITWQEQIAFLYDKDNFQLLNKFYYPMKEGWGLTYNGTHLIMSDGTSKLYFLDKDYFTEIGRIEVFDNNGPVDSLNELEYINGEVWANVYLTDTIVRINPQTGAVTAKIDLSGLLKSGDKTQDTNVLNGIAYDPVSKRLFVTGKNWPKLFEIEVYPKK
jgi:glutaminyl-peptide cyclotransferase